MSDFLDLQGAKDLNTDAIHIGAVANSKDPVTGAAIATHVNRVGGTDYTLRGFWNALGPVVMPWTSTTGGTLTQPNQAFLHPANGNYYSWTGAFPKVVAPGANPTSDAGYVPRAKITPAVTEALRRSYAEAGYTLVDGSFEEGGTLTSATDVLLHKSSGIAYSGPTWQVAPGTDPTAVGSGYVPRADVLLRSNVVLSADLSVAGSTVSIAGIDAGKVKDAADDVRAATIITEAGAQSVSAAQIGSSLLFTAATAVTMPTIASLGGVTGHYRIMAGSNPITLTRSDGLSFTVRGGSVSSVTIPAGSDCYVAYDTSGVYVYGLATYETIVKSYCLVNATGTGAPNELVSAELPVNLAINTRYVLTNPFGANVPITGWVEIFANDRWSQTGFAYISTTSGGYGVGFSYVQGEGIVIQTGTIALHATKSSYTGSGHGLTGSTNITSAPCRVFIQKLGA